MGTEGVAAAFLNQGALGLVALVALLAVVAVYRQAREERAQNDKSSREDRAAYDAARAELVKQIVQANERRADDARALATDCARALSENASALGAMTEAQKELRETLTMWSRKP